jgi:hypothetical protein
MKAIGENPALLPIGIAALASTAWFGHRLWKA